MKIPTRVPVIPVRDTAVFPKTEITLSVGREKSVRALEHAVENEMWILALAQRDGSKEDPGPDDVFRVGTLCSIVKSTGKARYGFQVSVQGKVRVSVGTVEDPGAGKPLFATIEALPDIAQDPKEVAAVAENVRRLAIEILKLLPGDSRSLQRILDGIDDPEQLLHVCAEQVAMPVSSKQQLLEASGLVERGELLYKVMDDFFKTLKVQSDVHKRLSAKMNKQQRESILREQLKAIREELGEGEGAGDEDYVEKVENAGLPEDAKKVALKEAKRLAGLSENSAEASVIRNYLDLILELPWQRTEAPHVEIDKAEEILVKRHDGLEKIKQRILQHIAVLELNRNKKGTILLLVGPPGVGKTSLGEAIAEALGRKFYRIALGGVRDESDIRGHRRTYVGAMPGRIIQGLKRAGVNNPVFLLDEVDKLGASLQGDPSAALLEVLDPEQNKTFTDHYLDLPYDLSDVVFIATANTLETIPGPLRDRMEVIQLTGYTTEEKKRIALTHLLPKQLKEHGLGSIDVSLTDGALYRLIERHTREAGVRELDRKLAALSRVAAEKYLRGGRKSDEKVLVTETDLKTYVGREIYIPEIARSGSIPGVVTGLAWTPVGGEILFIESRVMPGTGKLTLTGQLGDVMRESAQIALSLVRANLPAFMPGFDYAKTDVHVHVPQGAIPKDGPSAGVAMLTSLASLITNIGVDTKLAMTGEITLRGEVTPVGGIKEKVIAAHRAGMTTVMLPKRNEPDLEDVPAEVKNDLTFRLVEDVEEVLSFTLGITPGWRITMDGGKVAEVRGESLSPN